MCPRWDLPGANIRSLYRKRADSSRLTQAKVRLAALHRQLAYLEETRRQCREGLVNVEAAIAGKRAAIDSAEAEIRVRREHGEEA